MWYSLVDSNTLTTFTVTHDLPIVSEGQTLLTWPEGVDPVGSFYEPFKDLETGVISLVENTQKKLDAQWAQVRSQQRDLLYKSDWTCSVTDYEVPNKADWVTYRQALRDITLQTDPFNIEWPTLPASA